MSLRKIVTGTGTGAERAALDTAEALGIAAEVDRPGDRQSGKAVGNSDGTLIISYGPPAGNRRATHRPAANGREPLLHIDLGKMPAFRAAGAIDAWISENAIGVLYVTGQRAEEDPRIYKAVRRILEAACHLCAMRSDMPENVLADRAYAPPPVSIAEAVGRLLEELALKDRVAIANMAVDELDALRPTIGSWIRSHFRLELGNPELLRACRVSAGEPSMDGAEAAFHILEALWRRLHDSHRLRVV